MKARGRWAWLVLVVACAHREERALERASRDLAQAVARGDLADVRARSAPGYRDRIDEALVRPPSRRAWSRALTKPIEVHPEAIVMLGPDVPVRAVWTEEGWRFAEDPSDLYVQDTPRHALRALVLATRLQRWDVVLALAPRRYRMGLSTDDLRRAWTEGEQGEALQAARDVIAEHLADPIQADANEAVLELGPQHRARLEREGDRWVIVDFLPGG